MKKILLLIALFVGASVQSQVLINNTTQTPAQLVQNALVGQGVTPFNIKFNGSAASANLLRDQAGEFTVNFNGSTLGLTHGIVLATGNAQYGLGPNNCTNLGCGSLPSLNAGGTDADLAAITTNTIAASAILEFDFVATGLELNFDFVFGSEEYPEYVGNPSFNDVFGFFLSGPGINGPYTGNAKNIALIPNSITQISIGTVNYGTANNGVGAQNPNYFFNNLPSGLNPNNSATPTVEYDGFTKVIRAYSQLQCGMTYHIKLAVGNVGDTNLDSAVFIQNFTIPPLELLDEFGLDNNAGVCYGTPLTINSGLTVGTTVIKWFKDGVLIPGESGPDLVVTDSGVYKLEQYTAGGCLLASDDITITYLPDISLVQPQDINLCVPNAAQYDFGSIDQTTAVLGTLDPNFYTVTYYNTNTNNEALYGLPTGLIADADVQHYLTSATSSTIWIRVEDLLSGCVSLRQFDLNVDNPASGTISYGLTPFCESNTVPQPVIATGLTPGGTFSSSPPGLILDPNTGTITPNGSLYNTYTVQYEIPATAYCPVFTTTAQVIISNCNCTVVASSPGETVCVGQAITPITYTTTGATNGVLASGSLPPGVTGNYNSGVFTIFGTPTASGTYSYSVSITAGTDVCSANGTIIVNPDSTITLTSAASSDNQTLCENQSLAVNIIYTLTDATGATVTNLPTGINGVFNAGIFTISGTPTIAGIYNYTVTTTGNCASDSLGGTITVNTGVAMTLSTTSNDNQALCVNTALSPIVYNTANGVTNVTASNLPSGVSGSFSGGNFTLSGTPSAIGTYNYTVTTSGGCGTVTLPGTITVDSDSTIVLSSSSSSNIQTVCTNESLPVNIVYTTTHSSDVTSIGLPPGMTGVYSSGTYTISGSSTTAGVYN
ncbi:choice-of-anchor L domain-containing protein, partial [Flavobacterium sp. CYK-55]|uniref:choice-of-anchor L domain-containing protein n=1 Tax=Flavobacterium sp. CYK-55 TaxID=2835529 RepID=UPI001BCEBC37